MTATTAARATIGNTDPIASAFFLRFLCEPCNWAPALQETGKDSAHICALLYKQPHSPSAVDGQPVPQCGIVLLPTRGQTMNDEIKNWDIPAIVAAALADDLNINPDDLAASLAEIQAGQYHPVTITAITETRHKTGLSQNKFAAALGIPANTLKSWEQGQRKPSGAAAALLKLLDKHPELIHELGA